MKAETYKTLLKDLQKLQKAIVASQISAVRSDATLSARMARLHLEAEVGGRLDDFVATAARKSTVLFLLRTVFVRVLEDLGILGLKRIRGDWGYAAFREVAPALDHRAYFAFVFRDLAIDFPALFAPGDDELPLPDEDRCVDVWELWHHPNKDGDQYVWNGDGFDSRFLGDLYQDLDKDIRKRYALLQTPRFVEEYILDHTLTPALAEFDPATLREKGETFRLIDPTCGSGHFLIGAFHRLADYWRDRHGLNEWDACERALESVWGCDINPHAVDIAEFRLLLEVVARTGVRNLDRLAATKLNLRAIDSLVPWERTVTQRELFPARDRLDAYGTPAQRLDNADYFARAFHVVVGNPPYITPKDAAKRKDYARFWPESSFMNYALSAPFIERLFSLGCPGAFVGQITANSFMKRQFGKPLVETVLPRFELRRIVDTSGAYIPGHGTPTVILFGANRPPSNTPVWSILGKRGEPKRPAVASNGLVWRSVVSAGEEPNDDNPYISIALVPQDRYWQHPWSLGGGWSSQIAKDIETSAQTVLSKVTSVPIGLSCVVGEDESLTGASHEWRRFSAPRQYVYELVDGDSVRDYATCGASGRRTVLLPMTSPAGEVVPFDALDGARPRLWRVKQVLRRRRYRGAHQMEEAGKTWYELRRVSRDKFRSSLSIAFAFVSTHNQFALERDVKVFGRTAPVIKLSQDADPDDYLDLLGLLNSSTLGFWMKHVFHSKGSSSGEAIRSEDWEQFWEYDSTKMQDAPITAKDRESRIDLARALDAAARERSECVPARILMRSDWSSPELLNRLAEAQARFLELTERMVALQEELDWLTYRSYGLVDSGLHTISSFAVEALGLGHRPFEVVLARRNEELEDDERSTWWQRHGHTPVTEVPDRYSPGHRQRLEERIDAIEADARLGLLESPPFKRRWQTPDFGADTIAAAELWLLERLEDLFDRSSVGQLSEPKAYRLEEVVAALSRDARVPTVAGLWTGQGSAVDISVVVDALLNANALADNPMRIYSEGGLRKLAAWKRVWRLQDQDDAWTVAAKAARARGEAVPPRRLSDVECPENAVDDIPLPPKFEADDFTRTDYFSIRGKLDVPRERFVSFGELAPRRFGWNGWRDRQRALAQVDAFTLAENDAQNPLPPPTTDDPRRCGVTIGLWESLPDVRRWAAVGEYDELLSLAQEACRQARCPCPVLDAWKAKVLRGEAGDGEKLIPLTTKGKRTKKGRAEASVAPKAANAAPNVSLPERAWIAELLEAGKEIEVAGIWERHQRRLLEAERAAAVADGAAHGQLPLVVGPAAEGKGQLRLAYSALPGEVRGIDEARLAVVLDDLVASGDLAVRGRGKKKRYQLVPRATRG